MQSNYIYICFFAILISLAYGKTVKYADCGSTKSVVSSVDINPCDAEPCVLHKGTNVSVSIEFTPNEDVTAGKAVVHGIIMHVPAPFPLPDADLCKFSSPTCPLKAGQKYVYKNNLEVKSIYPSLRLVVQWELKDSNNNELVCVKMPVSISS